MLTGCNLTVMRKPRRIYLARAMMSTRSHILPQWYPSTIAHRTVSVLNVFPLFGNSQMSLSDTKNLQFNGQG
jgi:hypothetical protein